MMPILPNVRQETFAQNLAKGMTQADAYEQAGFAPSAANASVLARKPQIRARVLEISQDNELQGKSTPIPPLQTDPKTGLLTEGARGLTEEWLVSQLMTNIQQAQIAGKFREANTAIQMLGSYFGGLFDPKNPVDQTKKGDKDKGPIGDGKPVPSILDLAGAMSDALAKPGKDEEDDDDDKDA
jgi:hypothetical protein